jgi:NADH-quinone oxidoreductase subunit L
MMVALGFGEAGVGAAMLYLFCHAFFKALLFLGCGSVIHATEHQDVSELGGLRPKMPITSTTFFIGAMAMAGIFPLAGFWAKDEILVKASDFSIGVLILILITLPITAMYMWRVYALTFLGEPKDHHVYEHAHEQAPIMAWPLIALAVLATVAGFVVFEPVGEALGLGQGFLETVEHALVADPHHFEFDVGMAIISTILAGGGVLLAWKYFWAGDAAPAREYAARFPFFHALFLNKFYIDAFYQWVINYIVLGFAKVIAFFDRAVVNDTGVNGPGEVTNGAGFLLKLTQTGKLPNYALAMIIGVVVLAIVSYSVKG